MNHSESEPHAQSEPRPAEPQAPAALKKLQQDFANSISTPLLLGENAYTHQRDKFANATIHNMIANNISSGIERLEIYNQQFWFRLLTLGQTELPLLRRRCGLNAFNQLFTDYIHAYPSRHPELHHLFDSLGVFLQLQQPSPPSLSSPSQQQHEHQHTDHTDVLHKAAELDLYYHHAFFAIQQQDFDGSTFSSEQIQTLFQRPLPFISAHYLYDDPYQSVLHRHIAHSNPDDEHQLEAIHVHRYWVIYRSPLGNICEEELTDIFFQLLSHLKAGLCLTDAIEALIAAHPPTEHDQLLAQLSEHIHSIFARWGSLGWFCA